MDRPILNVRMPTGLRPALALPLLLAVCAAIVAGWPTPAFAASTVVTAVEIRRTSGAVVTQLSPLDTFFVDVYLSDADGYLDVTRCEMGLWYQSFGGYSAKPWRGVAFEWFRGPQRFVLNTPASDWAIIPGLSGTDTLTNSTAPQLLRFAVVVSRVARASLPNEWTVQIWKPGTNYKTWEWSMAEHLEFAAADTVARFAPGPPGALARPLIEPLGPLTVLVLSNTQTTLESRGHPLVGLSAPAFSIPVGGPASSLAWQRTVSTVPYAGPIDSVFTAMGPAVPANVDLGPQAVTYATTVDLPGSASEQTYRGDLDVRLRTALGGAIAGASVPLVATVTGSALAADSARGEVNPATVVAGTAGQPFTASVRTFISAGSSGVNWISAAVPAGYGLPVVTAARRDGSPIAFFDHSRGGRAETRLGVTVASDAVLEMDFTATAPTLADSVGQDFALAFDDTTTANPPQAATPGDANGLADHDGWGVRVLPGPVAQVVVTPATALVPSGTTAAFAAETRDGFGNPVVTSLAWRVEGGIGTVSPQGVFLATTAGSGRVIAESGAAADTALVTVPSVGSTMDVLPPDPQAGVLRPGVDTADLLRFRVANNTARAETLSVLSVEDASVGPPGVAERDGSCGPLVLVGSAATGLPFVAVGSARMVGGVVLFDRIGLPIADGDTATLVVRGGAGLRARDGDTLDLRIAGASALEFLPSAGVQGALPFAPPGGFTVDGMTAAQIVLDPVPSSPIGVGTSRHVALAPRVPGNGYDPDVLQRINVVQRGTALAGDDLARLEAWEDDGDGAFDAARDTRVGELRFTGDRWELTGLARVVPAGGLPMFITVDVADLATGARTVQLGLPTLPDAAFGMASANDGPLDAEIVSATGLVVSTADRVTLAARPIAPGIVRPGDRDVPLLALVATNTYAFARRVTSLALSNATAGPGSTAELDRESEALALRLDGDGDGTLGSLAVDPVVATGLWSAGRAVFNGPGWLLPPGQSRTMFVTCAVSTSGAADGDALSMLLASPLDVAFDSTTALVASWPVTSGASWVVDGLVAAQVRMLAAPGLTLGPGDGPLPALDLIVPRNGYRDDVLQGVSVRNRGTAGAADIAELRLWRDGGDGAFGGAIPDDQDLGPLTAFGAEWRSAFLNQAVGAGGVRLFVTLSATATPTDSSTVWLEVPVGGLLLASGDSGPLDQPVLNPDALVLSTAPLLADLSIAPAASIGGQSLTVRMTVRNQGGERVLGVAPSALVLSGPGGMSPTGGPTPAGADLDPGAQQIFSWTYDATSPGDARLEGFASGTGQTSGLARRALTARSNTHQIFTEADSVEVFTVESMPFAVAQGQTGVVPLTLTFVHPGGAGSSDALVRGLRVRLETETGAPIVPDALLAGVAVLEGGDVYLQRGALETSGDQVDLTLSTPAIVRPGDPVTLALRLSIGAGTTVPSFRIVLDDSSSFAAEDGTSGAPIRVRLQGAGYPVRTGLARIVAGATELRAALPALGARRANQGQPAVRLARLQLRNDGLPGITSDVRVAALAARLVLAGGAPIADPRGWLTRVRAVGPAQTLTDRPLGVADTAGIRLDFAPVLSVPVNLPVDVELLADIAPGAPVGAFHLELLDSTWFAARDANDGDPIPVRYDALPLRGDSITIERPADRLDADGIPEFPAAAAIGAPGLRALSLVLSHPGAADVARVRLDTLRLSVLDGARRVLAPGSRLARVELLWNGATLASFAGLSAVPGPLILPLPSTLVVPGRSETLTVIVDLQAVAPAGPIELIVDPAGLRVTDANQASPVTVVPAPGRPLPFSSGLVLLEPPARTLVADLESQLPPAVTPDGSVTAVARLRLRNPASGQQVIDLDHLVLIASTEGGTPLAIGRVCQRVEARVGGVPWASSAALTPDSVSATLSAAGVLAVTGGVERVVELVMTPRAGVESGRFRLGLDAAGLGVVQPASALLTIAVLPAPGRAFPLWTGPSALASAGLAASWSSFPNPFAAGREHATFVYFLPRPGRVTLRIFTGWGDPVATLLEGLPLPAGLRQIDRWDGRNGRGLVVANGFYVAELAVRFDDGSGERVLGKLAVLR